MTETIQTYGYWEEMDPADAQQSMSLDSVQLADHWRRCSLTSDFWAKYTALTIPIYTPKGCLNRSAIESVLSYLLNELFENLAKFSSGPLTEARYQMWLHGDSMVFQLRNHTQPHNQEPFKKLIQELLTSDLNELYFQRLEENAELNNSASGLGYLTLIKDYQIQFGFRFSQVSKDSTAVDVQAHVSMKEES